MFFHIRADAQRVLDRAQGEHLSQPHARQARLGGFGARGEQQLVVGLLKHRAGLEVLHRNRLAVRVDGRHLVPHAHIHPEAGVKTLGRLQRQLRRVLDHPADVIRQAAVGIGNIVRPLEYHDLRHLIQPADAGRRRGPACYAAYDNNFHAYCSTFPLHDRFSVPIRAQKSGPFPRFHRGKGPPVPCIGSHRPYLRCGTPVFPNGRRAAPPFCIRQISRLPPRAGRRACHQPS